MIRSELAAATATSQKSRQNPNAPDPRPLLQRGEACAGTDTGTGWRHSAFSLCRQLGDNAMPEVIVDNGEVLVEKKIVP